MTNTSHLKKRELRAPPATRPLSILFAVHTPWTEKLGVPRVSIELKRQLELRGHRCDRFALEESGIRSNRMTRPFTTFRFQRRLLRHIRAHGDRYDVIQAECNLLPYPRAAYRFDGVLIAKSNGLPHLYHEFLLKDRHARLVRESGERSTVAGNSLRWIAKRAAGGLKAVEKSIATADLVHLLNRDEVAFVRDRLGYGKKCVLVPNGLSDELAAALAISATAEQRAASNTVVFIGTWSLRKGKLEFPAIVRSIRKTRPQARFRLIGTCTEESEIQRAFDERDRPFVEVVESFEPDELPGLLADARCGVFPSYIEGFCLGVLEMLGAGIPVVAWDVPGPREMLCDSEAGTLVSPSDVDETANKVLQLLSHRDYSMLHNAALGAAAGFRWREIADTFVRYIDSSPADREPGQGVVRYGEQ